jgi:hypothetical protein
MVLSSVLSFSTPGKMSLGDPPEGQSESTLRQASNGKRRRDWTARRSMLKIISCLRNSVQHAVLPYPGNKTAMIGSFAILASRKIMLRIFRGLAFSVSQSADHPRRRIHPIFPSARRYRIASPASRTRRGPRQGGPVWSCRASELFVARTRHLPRISAFWSSAISYVRLGPRH